MSRPGDWNCRACNHLNFQRRESCQRCGEGRGGGGGGGGGGGEYGGYGGRIGSSLGFTTGPDVRPGDWYCSLANCGAHNFASRSTCFKCGASKDDGASTFDTEFARMRPFSFSSAATSSRSNWKSGDWICTRLGCNEHNFASRIECFRCSAPRDQPSSRSPFSS